MEYFPIMAYRVTVITFYSIEIIIIQYVHFIKYVSLKNSLVYEVKHLFSRKKIMLRETSDFIQTFTKPSKCRTIFIILCILR